MALAYRVLYSRASTLVNCQRCILENDSGRIFVSITVVGSGFPAGPLFINTTHTRGWLAATVRSESPVGLPVKSR